jgi:murein DD-endopeptidase MepM/ murein hydrolase activator NlpD
VRVAPIVLLAACGADAPIDVTSGGTPVQAAPVLVGEPFASPVANPAAISSTFGPRWKTSATRFDFHPGIDYPGTLGEPVFAIGSGTVEGVYKSGSETYPEGGNVVVVRHAIAPRRFHGVAVDQIFAVYLHLDSFAVAAGDTVVAGQPVGAMGMTGDTQFVHLHFETRVQTPCSLPYQTAHPESSCAVGFDPHVHPFLFVGGANADRFTVTELGPNAIRYTATRDDLDLDVIDTDLGRIGFSERAGIDATSLAKLDAIELGWVRIEPQPFSASSTEIIYDLYFDAAPHRLEIRDIYGRGLRF